MIIRRNDLKTEEIESNKGGTGISKVTHLTDKEGLGGKGRLFSMMELEPGHSVGSHTHENDFEIYYFLEGEGEVTDDSKVKRVYPGDVMITNEGHEHSLKNVGTTTLKFMALILYT